MNTKKSHVSRRTIKALALRIANAIHPQKIILFGSHSTGRYESDSDIDFFIITESRKRPAERVMDVWDAIYPAPCPVDIMVRTPAEIKKRLKIGDFFIKDILEKGKILYDNNINQRMG